MAEEDLDYALALSLQDQFDRGKKHQPQLHHLPLQTSTEKRYDPKSIVDKSWELTDPNPNIHNLFVQYDEMFFDGTLVSKGVAVSWSNRMTLCAGVCSYQGRCGFCSIRLSQPLLKLRPRRDLVQTLLHEMIHAYLFVTANNTDHDGHGPNFKHHMHRINELTGTKITIYHTFHDEVNVYRQHWWKCDGPCQKRPPYFGIVMRAMNREPSPRDPWWVEHKRSCGGSYSKIKEPEGYKKNRGKGEKAGTSRTATKGKGYILNGGNTKSRKIDDIFLPKDAKDKDKTINVAGGSGSHALKDINHSSRSNTVTAVASSSTNNTHDSIRNKMLAAAEKRQRESVSRGMVNSAGSSRKRPLSRPSLTSTGVPRDARGKCVSNKKPKLEPSRQDSKLTNLSKSTSPVQSLTQPVKQTTYHNHNIPVTSQFIDLCEDTPETLVESDPLSSKATVGKEGDDELIVIDDPTEIVFKTCPVCGMSNIPAVIINTHVSFCLDEEEASRYID